MDIEEVAAKTPEKILTFTVDPASGISGFHGRRVAFALGLEGKQVKQCVDLIEQALPAVHRQGRRDGGDQPADRDHATAT